MSDQVHPSSAASVAAEAFRAISIPDVIEAGELASRLHISTGAVLRQLRAGRLPGRKIGRRWVIGRAALLAWLARPEVATRVLPRDSERHDG